AAAHACRLSLSLDPYPGNAILELGSELVFALLGALLGGSGEPAGAAAREITEIERNILNEALPTIVDALRREWARFAEVGFDYKWAATDPQAIPSADEPVIVFRAGALTLVVPAEGIKRMQAAAPPRSVNPRDMSQRTLDRLRAAQVRVEARLEGAGMLIRDLLELKQGQVIAFSHPTDRPVDCAINGRSVYKGEMVTVGSKVAVQIGAESGEGTGG